MPTLWRRPRSRRRFYFIRCVLLAASVLGPRGDSRGVESDPLTSGLKLIPEDDSAWQRSLLWDKDVVLRAGFGYKDNVLLSANNPQSSPFFTSGLDLTIFRLPLDGWEFNFTVIGDDVRYTRSPGGLNSEDLVLTSAQLTRYFAQVWRVGADLRYSYVDQVLQEFLVAGGVRAVEAQGNTLGFRPFVRRELSTNWWLEVEAPLSREWWQSPLDSVWKLGGEAIVGFSYGPHSHISLAGGGFYIPHDEWLARDALGNEIPGRKLAIDREIVELKWEHQWDEDRHWITAVKLGFNRARDNGGGFYDYYRYFAGGELRFHTGKWDAKAFAGYSYYDFPVQRVGPPPAPLLHLGTADLNLRLERQIYKSLRGYASFEYERTTSNDPVSEYLYHIGAGGVSWEF